MCAPAQSAAWAAAWTRHSGLDHLVAEIATVDGAHVVLPLEIVRNGPFRVARFMGGSHANGNFPATIPASAGGTIDAAAIAAAVRAVRGDVDLVHLERMTETLSGQVNPLSLVGAIKSPNIALSVELDGGFDALLTRTSGKRKRKKHRAQTRKFEAIGGYRRVEAKNAADVDRLLTTFFAMKSARFRAMGISDVFAEPGVQSFFRMLFTDALATTPPQFVLHGLEVAGELRAITGSSCVGDRLICEFGAISDDDLAHTSPGEFLSFENIREACETGFAIYDFSIGDEPYKRLWCNIETTHYDLVIPVTANGRLLGAAIRATSGLKRTVKNNRALWALMKRLRKRAASPAVADDAD